MFTAKILAPINQCPLTSLETELKSPVEFALRFSDDKGRKRFIALDPETNKPCAALFLQPYGDGQWSIDGMYTRPSHRRKGYIKGLVAVAKFTLREQNVFWSQNLTKSGKATVESIEGVKIA